MFTKQELIGLRLILDHAAETASQVEGGMNYVRAVAPLRMRVVEEEALFAAGGKDTSITCPGCGRALVVEWGGKA